jgi:hypothetical protein
MTKSDSVRAYKAANPEASAPQIKAALKKEKIEVSLPLIYQILSSQAKPQRQNGSGETSISISALLEAKKTVAEIGSIEETRKALNLLAKLSS